VLQPKNASAGSSAHPVRVAGAGGFSATLHVNLTIFGFTLPTTPSMRSLFGMPTWNAVAASHNTTDDPRLTNALYKRYLKSGLMHRVSFGNFLSDGSARMQRDAAGVGGNASTARFVDEWGEFISNVELPFGPSPGRLSSVQAPALICGLSWDKHSNRFNNCTATEHTEQIGYWRNLSRVFEERGWLPLLFDYSGGPATSKRPVSAMSIRSDCALCCRQWTSRNAESATGAGRSSGGGLRWSGRQAPACRHWSPPALKPRATIVHSALSMCMYRSSMT
jgi:hypothetical protein